MDSLAIDCMLKQSEKDTIIVLRGRRIESYIRTVKSDSTYIATLEIDNENLVEALRKEKPKKKWWGLGGIILGLLSQLIF